MIDGKKLFLLVIVFICCFTLLFGQEQKSSLNQIDFGIGYKYIYTKDRLFSPLNYKGNSIAFQLVYKRKKKRKKLWGLSIDFQKGKLNADLSDLFTSNFIGGDLGFFYLKSINTNGFEFYIGSAYQFDISYIQFGYPDKNSQDALTFNVSHSLNPMAEFVYPITERQTLFASLHFPIISFVVRPPHTGWDEELEANQSKPLKLISNGYWTSLHEYQTFDATVSYQFNINQHLECGIKYLFGLKHLGGNNEFNFANHQALLFGSIKF